MAVLTDRRSRLFDRLTTAYLISAFSGSLDLVAGKMIPRGHCVFPVTLSRKVHQNIDVLLP